MGGEDHAGSADAALSSTFFEKALLDRVKLFIDGEAFDGGDLRAFGLQDGDEAGVYEISVHQDGAGPALAFATAFFRSGKVQIFAEDVEETLHRWDGEGRWRVVDGEVDGGHGVVASINEGISQGLKPLVDCCEMSGLKPGPISEATAGAKEATASAKTLQVSPLRIAEARCSGRDDRVWARLML